MPVIDSGSYTIGVIVDVDNAVIESEEGNNITTAGTALVNTRLYADLLAASVTATPTAVQSGDTVTLSAVVTNQGGWQSEGFSIYFYRSDDGVITPSDTIMGVAYLSGGLAAGGSTTVTKSLSMPVIDSGSYTIGVIVDVDNAVIESDEGNNTIPGNQITVIP